jgi:CRP/FNR family cyclic AMP-dependent transcriptional regulator
MLGARWHLTSFDMAGHENPPAGLRPLTAASGPHPGIASMLEELKLFSDFSRRQIEVLTRYVHAYEAAAGVQIVREGTRDHIGDLYVLVRGRIEITKRGEDGAPHRLTTVGAGRAVGDMSLIDGLPHSATATVSTPSTLILLTRERFDALSRDYSQLAMKLLWQLARMISRRLRQTSAMLVDHIDE